MVCEYMKKCKLYDYQGATCGSSAEAQDYCGRYKRLSETNKVKLTDFLKKGLEKILG